MPIVPTVSIGGQETQLFLTRGNWLARKLGLTKARMDILPISFGFPFGLSMIFPPNLPLPSKIVTEVLEPIDITARFGEGPRCRRGGRVRPFGDAEPRSTGWPSSAASRSSAESALRRIAVTEVLA